MIKLYIVNSKEILDLYNEYAILASKYFDCEDGDSDKVLSQYESKKNELEQYLDKEEYAAEFTDEYYDEKIPDEETKMLLSDGFYSIKEVEKLTKKCAPEFRKKVMMIVKNIKGCILKRFFCRKNNSDEQQKQILFWSL